MSARPDIHPSSSYAVCWREDDGAVHVGKLQLRDGRVELAGRSHALSIAFDEIGSVTFARAAAERVRERPALILEQTSGARLFVSSLTGIGVLHELAATLEQRLFLHAEELRDGFAVVDETA